MPNEQILVDGFYCAYRSAYAFGDFRTKDGRPSGLLFGFIRTLTSIMKKWPSAEIVICWDSPSGWRRNVYPEYKGNRTSSKEVKDRNQIYAAAAFCKAVGIKQAMSAGNEADDVIGSLVDRSRLNIVFSRDRDFCQLVEDGVLFVYSPKSGNTEEIIYDEAEVLKKFGVPAKKLLMFRVLRGDSSDNLPGLRRFPSKKIADLVMAHQAITDIFDERDPSIGLTDHQKKTLEEFRNQALINERLMRVQTDIEVRLIPGTFQRERALSILDDYELKSLKSSVATFEEKEEEDLGFFA